MKWRYPREIFKPKVLTGEVDGPILEEQSHQKFEFGRIGTFALKLYGYRDRNMRDCWRSFDEFDALKPEYSGEEVMVQYNAQVGGCEVKAYAKQHSITIN